MKKNLFSLFILISLFSKGQIVNFPDTILRNILIQQGVDVNHDSLIEQNEAAAVTELTLIYSSNNQTLPADNTWLTNLTGINSLVNLKKLVYRMRGALENLDFSGLPNLEYCDLRLSNFDDVGPWPPAVKRINLSGLTKLKHVYASGAYNNIWTQSYVTDGHLENINVSGCSQLQYLNCSYTTLDTLDLTGLSHLDTLICVYTKLNDIDLSPCPGLRLFDCGFTNIDTLDISHNPNLFSLDCYGTHLKYLNIKNGTKFPRLNGNGHPANPWYQLGLNYTDTAFFQIGDNAFGGTPNLKYVCTDEDERNEINYFLNGPDDIWLPPHGVCVNSYCSFTPGGNYNTLTGNVRIDINQNGCDISDALLPEMKISIQKVAENANLFTLSNPNGQYNAYLNTGSYVIKPVFYNPYYSISPDSVLIDFPLLNNTVQIVNFCIVPNVGGIDVEVKILPIGRIRPGFVTRYELVYKNKGGTIVSGDVRLKFDTSRLNFLNANPFVTTQNPGEITWQYNNLKPLEGSSIKVDFLAYPPPVNNVDDSLFFTTSINPLSSDATPSDNIDSLKQFITGSYDPNDKTCLQGTVIDYSKKDVFIDYIIRFQNTGNDTAFNVVVKDILTDNYDWSSFEFIKTSHQCVTNQTNGNKLEFIFESINLPPKTINDSASNGFIAFKIKPKSTIVLNDVLENKAAIYFDYNLPVITNTTSTVYVEKTLPLKMEYFKGTARSGNNYLTWKANCNSAAATFNIERSANSRNFISISNLTATNTRCLQPFDFIDNNPFTGINYYRIKMTDAAGLVNYSNTIVLLNKKPGFEIINITPTPIVTGTALLTISAAADEFVNIAVTDVSGKTIQTLTQNIVAGFNKVKMDFRKLVAGTYMIVVKTALGDSKTRQFIKY